MRASISALLGLIYGILPFVLVIGCCNSNYVYDISRSPISAEAIKKDLIAIGSVDLRDHIWNFAAEDPIIISDAKTYDFANGKQIVQCEIRTSKRNGALWLTGYIGMEYRDDRLQRVWAMSGLSVKKPIK